MTAATPTTVVITEAEHIERVAASWRRNYPSVVLDIEKQAAAKVRADLIKRVEGLADDALANAIYVGVVNPDLTWWDDLTPDMQEAYRAGARSARRHLAALLRDDKEAGGGD